MNTFKHLLFFILLTPSVFAVPEIVDVQIDKTIVPRGFDKSERVQFAVFGVLNNTCKQVGPYALKMDPESKTIIVQQQAYFFKNKHCVEEKIPYYQIINVGILEGGSFRIIDKYNGIEIGNLTVEREAKILPASYSYAPVSNVQVLVKNAPEESNTLLLTGNYSGNCWKFEGADVEYQDGFIMVSPLIKAEGVSATCENSKTAFTEKITLRNDIVGVQLIHIRTLNGLGLNKVAYFE